MGEDSTAISRRSMIKQGAVAAGVAGLVWSAPRIEGLSLRPNYAAAMSGPAAVQFVTGASFVEVPHSPSPCGTPGSFRGNTFKFPSSVGFSVNTFTGGTLVGPPTADAGGVAGTVQWSSLNQTGQANFPGPAAVMVVKFDVLCA